MEHLQHFDIAIIGAGAGGLAIAAAASQLGYKVILFEKHKMGGDCLNYSCVPTKSILAASKAMYNLKEVHKFGIFTHGAEVDFVRMQRHVQQVINQIAPHNSIEHFEKLGVTVVKGEAKFADTTTVECNGNHYTAKKIIIATGSAPIIPPIKGIHNVPYLTNETILELEKCPQNLVIIGGGPIGCEMAQGYRRLGAYVTIIESRSHLLLKEEPQIVKMLTDQFAKEGIKIYTSAHVVDTWQSGDDIILKIEKEGDTTELRCSHLLIAAGRKANMHTLELKKAGITYNDRHIVVNKSMQTTNPAIYAVGDVADTYRFTHMASYQASVVINRVLFGNIFSKVHYNAVPWCIYTDPELAHVGLTETQAQETYGTKNIRCISLPFANTDRAKIERKKRGIIKVVIGKRGRILGVTILGHLAGELIQQWTILISHKMRIKDLLKVIYPYPTFSEINRQVVSEYYKNSFYSQRTGKISRFLFKYLG